MHNSLILSHFFAFLQERDLLTLYMKALVDSTDAASHYLEMLFFAFPPSDWILSAFTWEKHTSINWRSVNDLWLARLNTLENSESSK